jgi:hypothetical protein
VTDDEYQPVAVSRRICAPAHDIFEVLANPVRHPEFDGSQMLRGAVSPMVISAAGDVFVMKMYYSQIGEYEMNNHMVEYEQDRRIGWEPEAGRGHPDYDPGSPAPARWGQRWIYQLTPDGPDATIVTEIYDCSAVPEHERVGIDNGAIWAEDMARTLERLDALCAGRKPAQPVRKTASLLVRPARCPDAQLVTGAVREPLVPAHRPMLGPVSRIKGGQGYLAENLAIQGREDALADDQDRVDINVDADSGSEPPHQQGRVTKRPGVPEQGHVHQLARAEAARDRESGLQFAPQGAVECLMHVMPIVIGSEQALPHETFGDLVRATSRDAPRHRPSRCRPGESRNPNPAGAAGVPAAPDPQTS